MQLYMQAINIIVGMLLVYSWFNKYLHRRAYFLLNMLCESADLERYDLRITV